MAGHCQTEQFVLANNFDQKQSANMFVIHWIFLSIWNIFKSNLFLSPFCIYFFYQSSKPTEQKQLFFQKRGQMGSIFNLLHAECWGEGRRPSHRYCLTDMTVCKGGLINAGQHMGIVITEMEEYCPKVKMEQQGGALWCYPAKSICFHLKFAPKSASWSHLRGTQQLAVSWTGHS